MKHKALLFVVLIACLLGTVSAESVQASDKLGVAVPYPLRRVDPLVLDEPVNRIVLQNLSSGLTAVGAGNKPELTLLLSLTEEKGGELWTATIRDNARFPSQKILTAEDVVSSYKFLFKLAARRPHETIDDALNSLFAAKIEVSPKDPESGLEIRLGSPEPKLALLLSLAPVLEVSIAEAFGEDLGLGTNLSILGPYQIRENKPDQGILLERVPDFYLPGKPRAAFVEFRSFESDEEALRALRVGAVDIIALPTEAQIENIKDDPTLISLESPLVNLSALTGSWNLLRDYWSTETTEEHRLKSDRIIVRKSLSLDEALLSRFELSGTFLP